MWQDSDFAYWRAAYEGQKKDGRVLQTYDPYVQTITKKPQHFAGAFLRSQRSMELCKNKFCRTIYQIIAIFRCDRRVIVL